MSLKTNLTPQTRRFGSADNDSLCVAMCSSATSMKRLDLLLPTEDVNTVGGLVLQAFGSTPVVGDTIGIGPEENSMDVRVESVYQHGIAAVSFAATPEQVERVQAVQKSNG